MQKVTEAKVKTEESQTKEEIIIAWNGVEVEGTVNRWDVEHKASSLQTELRKEDSSATATANGTNITVKYKGYDATINTTNGSLTNFAKSSGSGDVPNALTVGEAYDNQLIKIGDPFTYTADTQTEWIVFGKDENGDVLLTTATPVEDNKFTLIYNVQHWLSYETDLHTHCANLYSNVSKGITARSITIEDINRVTGYTEPPLTPITFGTGEGEYNYYYPTTATANAGTKPYWKKPTGAAEKTFTSNEIHAAYFYNNSDVTNTNSKYVFGESSGETNYGSGSGASSGSGSGASSGSGSGASSGSGSGDYSGVTNGLFHYLLATRSIIINPYMLLYDCGSVGSGAVNSYGRSLCNAANSFATDFNVSETRPIRPIVVLPSDIGVVEGVDGLYALAE